MSQVEAPEQVWIDFRDVPASGLWRVYTAPNPFAQVKYNRAPKCAECGRDREWHEPIISAFDLDVTHPPDHLFSQPNQQAAEQDRDQGGDAGLSRSQTAIPKDSVESADPTRCVVTCEHFPMHTCSAPHQCIKDGGHSFDPMYGEVHEFETHLIPARRGFYAHPTSDVSGNEYLGTIARDDPK
jgi:hypothetical protein